jgi:hypothetical protein
MNYPNPPLHASVTPGAEASFPPAGQGHLRLPPGPSGQYSLAQWDDYRNLPRRRFPWQPPLTFSLQTRASHGTLPGTWGFGLWNDPMSLSFGFGSQRKLPALPNAVWFFFASPENALTFRDDLPANGALATTFRAPRVPVWLFAPGAVALPLLLFRPTARLLRRLASHLIQQDSAALDLDPTEWHAYAFRWETRHVTFEVDGRIVLETPISPRGPLGLVIWIDNQYAAWKPDGSLKWGALEGVGGGIKVQELLIVPH